MSKNSIEGFSGYDDDAPPPLPVEYPAIEDLGFADGLIPSGEEMKEVLTAAGALAAAVVAAAFLSKKINVNAWVKIGGTAVIGLIGGSMLARKVSRPVGMGVGVGLVGLAIASAISKLTKLSIALEDDIDDEVRRSLTGIEVLPEETMLAPGGGMNQIDTDTEHRYGVGEAVGVETERKLSGGGWDEAVGVETEHKYSGVGSWIGGA